MEDTLLQWYLEAGVDECLEAGPRNWLRQQQSQEKKIIPAVPTPMPDTAPASKTLSQSHVVPPRHGIQDARQSASRCTTLEELAEAVRSFEGLAIKKTANKTVFADGNPKAGVMCIGEAPGAEEDMQGIPFCGASGQLLDQMLACIGLTRGDNMYITNTIFWRPPGNRRPTPEELAICLPFVEKHIALVAPKLLILVGGTAVASLMDEKQTITRLRGKFFTYANALLPAPIPATAVFHPSYLLRSPGQKRQMWQDLLGIKAYLKAHKIV